jgi:tRNA wybutosine-synthesizing protein 4
MDVEAADALIRWTGTLPHGELILSPTQYPTNNLSARFCLLEQLLPEGINHPFAKTMMAHFDKLQTPLKAVQKYPTTTDQCERFKNFGWPIVSVCNLWELWGSSDFASISERKELDKIEPFDEWEEFALFGCHYFLLIADTTSIPSQTLGSKSKIQEDQSRTGFLRRVPQGARLQQICSRIADQRSKPLSRCNRRFWRNGAVNEDKLGGYLQ